MTRHVELFSCSKCGKGHSRFRNKEKVKPASYCLACHSEHMRRTRAKYSEFSDEQKKRSNARAYANTYQRRGHLEPEPCRSCGSYDVEKHHADYDKPLDVQWLCRPCHLEHHHELD